MLASTKPRFLAAIIITIPLLLLAVSAQLQGGGHHRPLHGLTKPHFRIAGFQSKINGGMINAKVVKAFTEAHYKSHSREFLRAHNKVRLHSGQPPYIWDRKLARYARRFAAKRAADCQMVHSNGEYGENIFWGGRDHWTPTEIVRSWVSEHKYYKKKTNECEPGKMCGHYTQIVWRESVRLGCARVKCNDGGVFALCEYEPAGNFLNESPFAVRNESPSMKDSTGKSPTMASSSSTATGSAQNATPSG